MICINTNIIFVCDSIAYERRAVFTRGRVHIIYIIYNILYNIRIFYSRIKNLYEYGTTHVRRESTLYTSICAEIVQRTHFYNSSFFFFFFFFFFTFFFLLLFVFFFFFFFFFVCDRVLTV